MSNTGMIIEERSRDIGDFLVGRYLPFRKKRMVGPFIFVDHMGPSQVGPDSFMNIGQHPHIGLSTLTYLFEGEMIHRDTTGASQRVRPGEVNWMTSGKGVVHTERSPVDWKDGQTRNVHGFQIWVALPKEKEEMEPEFFHAAMEDLPSWKEQGMDMTLVAGKAFGREAPVPVFSELFMMEAKANEDTAFISGDHLQGEIAICIVEGSIEACGEKVSKGQLLVSKQEDQCRIKVHAGSHLLIFGGQPFPEKRYIWWNFVATNQELIEAAKTRWANKEFPLMSDDPSYIPMPKR